MIRPELVGLIRWNMNGFDCMLSASKRKEVNNDLHSHI